MDRPPCSKLGEPLNGCAIALKRQQIECNYDLPAEFWKGWKIRGAWLIGPGGIRVNARALRGAWLGNPELRFQGAMRDK